MERIKACGYTLLVEKENTRKYYDATTSDMLCQCDGCQNYYPKIKGKFPQLEEFLSSLGVDIEKPDELAWWEMEKTVDYLAYYTVCGAIEEEGEEFSLSGLTVKISNDYAPNNQSEAYFVISVMPIILPGGLNKICYDDPKKESVFTKIKRIFKR